MLADESAGERMILCFDSDALPEPLPELGWRCPELLSVAAEYERRSLLLFFLLFLHAQFCSPVRTRTYFHPLRAALTSTKRMWESRCAPQGSL